EDGIRDFHVTGVQTCALPISYVVGSYEDIDDFISARSRASTVNVEAAFPIRPLEFGRFEFRPEIYGKLETKQQDEKTYFAGTERSEERRVGKEGRSPGSREHG